MADHLGSYNVTGSRTHVRFHFTTHAGSGAAVAPNSAFENADLRIFKATDGAAFSATQRTSANGITMTSPFDSVTGLHDVDIDLTDNTDAGFYVAGSFYSVVLTPDETVDGVAVVRVLAYFEIGPPPVNVTQFAGTAITSAAGIPEVKVASIANDAITAASIAANAIGASEIADGAIDAGAFAADAITAAKIAADVTTELQSGLATAASITSLDAKVDVIDDFLDTEVAAILAAVDTEVAAIKAKTDQLTFTKANEIDANIQSINGTTVNGDGSGTPWGP